MTLRAFLASIADRAKATGRVFLKALAAEPIVVLTACYTFAVGIYGAVTGDLADGSLDLQVLLPAVGALAVRLVAAVPRLRDIAGVWSPKSAAVLAERTDLEAEAAVLMAEERLVLDTPKPEDDQ